MSTSQFSALSALPGSNPRNPDPTARRRRTSVSGKLLSFFATKHRSDTAPPPVQRPVISRPQPLERHASSTRVPTHTNAQPAGRKRSHTEASGDENDDDDRPTREDRRNDGPRASSRPRLDSNASTHTVPPSHPIQDAAPTLKSALKKPAEPQTRTSKGLLSPRFSHTRSKAALKAETGHNRGASAPPSSFTHPSQPARDKRHPERGSNATVASSTPSASTSNATTSRHAVQHPPTSKKTVTFAADPKMSLKRSRTLRNLSATTDHWTDLTGEIDALDAPHELIFSTLDTSDAASTSPCPPTSPRRRFDPVFIPGTSLRARKSLPLPPVLSTGPRDARAGAGGTQHADTRSRSHFRDVLARQAPPTPEAALKLEPFQLPGAAGASTKRRSGKVTERELEKENGASASTLLDEVLKEIARDKAEREQERGGSAEKPTTPPNLLGARSVLRRFKVDIVPGARHTTIWDGQDSDIYAWQGTLEIRDDKPASYFYPRHAIHDVSIQFHTVAEPREDPVTFDPTPFSPSSSSPPRPKYEWQATYSGTRLSSTESTASTAPTLDPARGIALEYAPQLQPGDDPDGPCTWLVRFWVPVPLHLFARAEHRTFVCRAKVTVRDWETPHTVIPGGCVAIGIERLRTARLLAGGAAVMAMR